MLKASMKREKQKREKRLDPLPKAMFLVYFVEV